MRNSPVSNVPGFLLRALKTGYRVPKIVALLPVDCEGLVICTGRRAARGTRDNRSRKVILCGTGSLLPVGDDGMKMIALLTTVGLLAAVVTYAEESNQVPEHGTVGERHRGVCFVAGPRRPTDGAFDRLPELNVNWISQTPFGWQRRHDDPEVVLVTSGRVWWGERDAGLVETTHKAQLRGIRTILKPHIWIRDRRDGKWRGEIDFANKEDWEAWWVGYRRFILHYAALAEKHGMEALCVGTELRSTVLKHPDKWRELILEARKIFSGELTYSANWYQEFEEVPFWDMLDYIGIQAYFPLGNNEEDVTLSSLKTAWQPYIERIEAVQKRFGKPVIFTEVGYRSTEDAAEEPWVWRSGDRVDFEVQALCYEAMFEVFWDRPWFKGLYIWKWFPDGRVSYRRRRGFTPQGKPAEAVLRKWYVSAE